MTGFAGFGWGMLEKLATNLSDTYGTGDTLHEKQRKDAQYDYLERERQGIVSRVEGAKAAGIHPLVAMGYQGGNSPTNIIGGSQLPSYHGEPDAPPPPERDPVDPSIARYNAARARLAEAQASQAELDLARSQRALAGQPGQPVPVLPTDPRNLDLGVKAGVKIVPDQVTAGTSGLTAGTHPGATAFAMPWGSTWSLPSDKLSQALEDLELAKYYMLIRANAPGLWQEFVSQFPTPESVREMESLKKRYPPKGQPAKWPPRMHGGRVE